MICRIAVLFLVLLPATRSLAVDGLAPLWTRDKDAGTATSDQAVRYQNQPSLRVQHTGMQDWCLNSARPLAVKEGDILEIATAVEIAQGGVSIAAILYDARHNALNWSYGATEERGQGDWKQVSARMVIPAGATSAVPRILGSGKATVWIGAFSYRIVGRLDDLRQGNMPDQIQIRNKTIQATFITRDATLQVTDLRNGRTWAQSPAARDCFVKSANVQDGRIRVELMEVANNREFSVTFELDGDRPEVLAKLAGAGQLRKALAYPAPFVTAPGSYLVVPMNEGISYPVDDESIRPMRLIAYGGHGICMPFFGATDGSAGYSAIFETPDDAAIRIDRTAAALPASPTAPAGRTRVGQSVKLLSIAPEWDAQRGQFGYERRIRYCFFDTGGHVAIAKRYRQYAQSIGLFKPFTKKREKNPNIDLLVGAVNVWGFDRDPVGIVREMQAAGIQRILWSSAASPQQIVQLNALNALTSRYDIYQDVMDPAKFPQLRGTHPDWTTAAWPQDLMLRPDGDWVRGWEVKSRAGEMIPCGVVCDKQALPYADARIGTELKTHAYRGRFIDTTTASPYRECYSPDHPMTRSDSRKYKMELLALVSDKYKLVCGSETGHDAAVPVCDFFEGMMSLGPYRVPDAGRDIQRIWTDVPENVAKFQLGHRYRLPLWELVYHECMVSYWYWGDYNNKLPALWDKRDRFNALYGTPPMFMFNRAIWNDQKTRFVQSYQASAEITRACGYSEMTDHRFLTLDRDVQQTSFSNGMKVTANFGETGYRMNDGVEVGAGAIRIEK